MVREAELLGDEVDGAEDGAQLALQHPALLHLQGQQEARPHPIHLVQSSTLGSPDSVGGFFAWALRPKRLPSPESRHPDSSAHACARVHCQSEAVGEASELGDGPVEGGGAWDWRRGLAWPPPTHPVHLHLPAPSFE